MNHNQFLQKLWSTVQDKKIVEPIASFKLRSLNINVYQNDVLRVPSESIICGKLTPVNPLGVIFPEFCGVGLAWGYTPACPSEIQSSIDEEVVIPIGSSEVTLAKYIGVVNPLYRSMQNQLTRTIESLTGELCCQSVSIIAPTRGEPNSLKCISANEVVDAVINTVNDKALLVNLVDEWNPMPYVEQLRERGISQLF